METTSTKPPVTAELLQARYNALLTVVDARGGEGKARVTAHLSAITSPPSTNLKGYHERVDIDADTKYAEYGRIAAAFGITKDATGKTIVGAPDWTKLEGQSTPAKVNSEQLDAAWESLNRSLKAHGNDGQQRVAAHIRAVTGNKFNNIGVYHIAKSVSSEDKAKQYGIILTALASSDWSKLEGQLGVGAKVADVEPLTPVNRIDPHAESDLPESKPEPAVVTPPAPATHEATRKPNVTQVERHVNVSPGDTKLTEKMVTDYLNPRTPAEKEAQNMSIEEFLIRKLSGHIVGNPNTPSDIDEGKVRLIVAEEVKKLDIHAEVKKANANGAFPADHVEKLIKDALVGLAYRVELVRPDGSIKPIEGLMHPQCPQIVAWLLAGVPVWLWGAAGAGKTHMARQIAEMLEVDPHVISVDPTLTVAKLLGYRNVANGDFVQGFLYKPFKDGGLAALDEVDTGDPGVVASNNALLSNGHYLFPNGETVTKHTKFHVLAMANTKGTGAVAGYTARNRLDAATLDRFAVIECKYDEGLESALACGIGAPAAPWKSGEPASQAVQQSYVQWVQSVRREFGNSVLISPRASINGCKALRAGIPMQEVVDALVFKLVADDTKTRIADKCGKLPKEVA